MTDAPTLAFDDDGWASAEFELDGRKLLVNIVFEDAPSQALLEPAAGMMQALSTHDETARRALVDELTVGDPEAASSWYRTHHLEAGLDVPADPAAFVASLLLTGMMLCPDRPERMLGLDYSINPELTQYVLGVTLDAEGKVKGIEMES